MENLKGIIVKMIKDIKGKNMELIEENKNKREKINREILGEDNSEL